MMFKSKEEWIAWAKEWKLGIFLFANAILFTLIFYSDISERAGIGSREIIGDITYKYNRIERKFDREISWNPIDANSPVTNRDTVKTEKDSIVAIQLKDGTEIEMDEESMVILEISPKRRKIRFEQGSINIKKKSVAGEAKSSIMVESPQGSVEVNDGDVIVAKKVEENMDVAVSRGNALVELDGQTIELQKNQILQSAEGEISAKNTPVRMIDPVEKARAIERRITASNGRTKRLNLPVPNSKTSQSNPKQNTIDVLEAEPTKIVQEKTKVTSPTTGTSSNNQNIKELKKQPSKPKRTEPKKSQPPKTTQTEQEIIDEKELQRRKEQAEFERFMKM